MNITKNIPDIFRAYGDTRIKYELASGETDTSKSITLIIGSDAPITLTAEFFNGVAELDLRGVLQNIFYSAPSQITTAGTQLEAYNDFLLSRILLCSVNPEGGHYLCAVNSSQQFGQSNSLTSYRGKWLTEFDKIIRYSGYERNVAFLVNNSEGGTFTRLKFVRAKPFGNILKWLRTYHDTLPLAYIDIDKLARTDTDLTTADFDTVSSFDLYLVPFTTTDFQGGIDDPYHNDTIELDGNSLPVSVIGQPSFTSYLKIEKHDIPQHPFYVKWINRIGGYDYWMFDCRHTFKRKVKNGEKYTKYTDSIQTATGNKVVFDKEATEIVEASASQLTENEFENVSAILYAPLVQWYDESREAWIDIIVEGDAAYLYGSPRTDIEFTFTLPTPNLQIL